MLVLRLMVLRLFNDALLTAEFIISDGEEMILYCINERVLKKQSWIVSVYCPSIHLEWPRKTAQADDENCHVSNFIFLLAKRLFQACPAVLGLQSTFK
jgi:hypothetical protein